MSSADNAGPSGVSILTSTLANIDAASLLIGGLRTDRADGSTAIDVTASEIHVRNFSSDKATAGQAINLSAPELLLAVDGSNSRLDISDNAVITATGQLADTRAGLYDLTTRTSDTAPSTGAFGSLLRIANGPERLVSRFGDVMPDGKDKSDFTIGLATLSGQSLTLDSSHNLDIDAANLAVDRVALGSDTIAFSTRTFGVQGFIISPALEAKLAQIAQVTLISPNSIGFSPAVVSEGGPGAHVFRDLVIDAPGIRAIRPTSGKKDTDPISIVIDTDNVSIRNSFADLGGCTRTGLLACTTTGNSLAINASGSLTLGSGTFRTYGFESTVTGNSLREGSVAIAALGGVYYTGKGSLELNNARFTLTTPFIVERGTDAVPKSGTVPGRLCHQHRQLGRDRVGAGRAGRPSAVDARLAGRALRHRVPGQSGRITAARQWRPRQRRQHHGQRNADPGHGGDHRPLRAAGSQHRRRGRAGRQRLPEDLRQGRRSGPGDRHRQCRRHQSHRQDRRSGHRRAHDAQPRRQRRQYGQPRALCERGQDHRRQGRQSPDERQEWRWQLHLRFRQEQLRARRFRA